MVGRAGSNSGNVNEASGSALGPSNCASRDRAADAAGAVQDMAALMNRMDPGVVERLVQARNAAAGVYHAFPEGDQRFASIESESEEENEAEEDLDEDDGAYAEAESGELGDDAELCKGLLDDEMYHGPRACLQGTSDKFGFDLVREMDEAGLEFFQRIRLVNHLRKTNLEGCKPALAVEIVRKVLTTKDDSVLENDALLEPVIKGDLILTVLEGDGDTSKCEADDNKDVIDAIHNSLRTSKIV